MKAYRYYIEIEVVIPPAKHWAFMSIHLFLQKWGILFVDSAVSVIKVDTTEDI